LEKKKQKAFARWHTRPGSKWAALMKWQKFFGSFFQKRALPFFFCLIYYIYMPDSRSSRVLNKVALITGAASGIGRACAERLAAEGARVVLTDMRLDAARIAADAIVAEGNDAVPLHLDVTDPESWAGCVADIDRQFGRLDILVNNAGIATGGPSIADFGLATWRLQQAVNVDGVFLGTKYCLPLMRRGGGGSIINMSSIAGLVGSAGMAAYAATKGAVRLFTKSIALECALRRDGVRVNSVHPGLIETPLWDGIIASSGIQQAAITDVATAAVPLGFVGTPADVAWGVLFLAADESRYMTGSELVIDGGLTAR
jgi:NAD(P)-dependent dehydrogenase (short-subunit alcohol dehydrogenase family)